MSALHARMAHLLWLPLGVLLLSLLQLALWAADRAPPFVLASVMVSTAAPGRTVQLEALVRREISRRCSVHYTRQIFDGAGVRHDLEGEQYNSAEAIEHMERRNPGRLLLAIAISADARPGSAALVEARRYQCNPLHALWPIEVTTVMPFTIAAP